MHHKRDGRGDPQVVQDLGRPPRVALFCHADSPFNAVGVASWLAGEFQLVGIVEIRETRSRLMERARREIRRSGFLGLLDVLAFRMYYKLRWAKRDARWIAERVAELQSRYRPDLTGVPRVVVRNPNDEETRDFLRRVRPDFAIARCKFILKREIFETPSCGTFVLHPGICPEYRNAHGCFWALANRDMSRVGVTLLQIDEGIDTGPIFFQETCRFDEVNESHVVIQFRMVFENLCAIRDALLGVCRGERKPIPVAGRRSHMWGQPTLSSYVRWKRAAKASAASRQDR